MLAACVKCFCFVSLLVPAMFEHKNKRYLIALIAGPASICLATHLSHHFAVTLVVHVDMV